MNKFSIIKSLLLLALVGVLTASCAMEGKRFNPTKAEKANLYKSIEEPIVYFPQNRAEPKNPKYAEFAPTYSSEKAKARLKEYKLKRKYITIDVSFLIGTCCPLIYSFGGGKLYLLRSYLSGRGYVYTPVRSIYTYYSEGEGFCWPWQYWRYYLPDTGHRRAMRLYFENPKHSHSPARINTGHRKYTSHNGYYGSKTYTSGSSGYTGSKWTAMPGSTYRPYPTYK